ncbi:MAG: hypothetical protein ACI9F9_002713 [Candidatus Paceibacteria bacterium]
MPPGFHGYSQVPALRDRGSLPVRQFAFSMGGVSQGFAAHDERYSFQATNHATRGDHSLLESWYGTTAEDQKSRRMYLRDRESESGPGDQGPAAVQGVRSAALLRAGEDWYKWVKQARIALHAPPWLAGTQSAEVLAELVARGLIADQPN